MDFSRLIKKAEHLVSENSTVILTAVGVVGTVATAVLTGQASFKAVRVIDDLESMEPIEGQSLVVTKQEIVKAVLPLYLPAAAVGVTTIASIIFANRISTKRAAALAAAYGITDKAFQEYKDKVTKVLGERKELALRDEINQDRVTENPVGSRQVIIAGNGDVLCYDAITGRYFMSTMETIRRAENTVNYEIIHHMYASLSKLYDEIGLPPTSYSDEVGWNSNNLLEVTYSTTMSTDGRPCIVMDFTVAPITGYNQMY